MQPNNRNIAQALVNMFSASGSATRARAENMVFEERIDAARQEPYEAGYAPAVPSYRAFLASHKRYVKKAVYVADPETFQAVNGAAALPALASPMAAGQILVRIECLDFALSNTSVKSLADLEHLRAVYRGERHDATMNAGDAKAALEKVCLSLNSNPNAVRPRFAAFAQDLADDIEEDDWAERLRDRLGLPHYPSTKRFGPHPVVLMRYTVGEVVDRAQKLGLAHAVTVPTVLDAEPYEVFHPAPRQETYGRTLNLAGDSECARLASEVLHPRIDYEPSHIWKVGAITRKAGLSPKRLAELRDGHRFCLQYLSGRNDFGTL